MIWLRRLRWAAYRRMAAALCRLGLHDLPRGFTRVAPADPIPGLPISYADGPIWDVGCRWCYRRFTAQADARHQALAAHLERTMERHRAGLRRPGADRRPS